MSRISSSFHCLFLQCCNGWSVVDSVYQLWNSIQMSCNIKLLNYKFIKRIKKILGINSRRLLGLTSSKPPKHVAYVQPAAERHSAK